jgi:hypothetical protein
LGGKRVKLSISQNWKQKNPRKKKKETYVKRHIIQKRKSNRQWRETNKENGKKKIRCDTCTDRCELCSARSGGFSAREMEAPARVAEQQQS